jgi:integrase
MPKQRQGKVPGSIYLNGKRFWWDVRLPGEVQRRQIPLKPDGARFATKNRDVAEEVARALYARATVATATASDALPPDRIETVADLVRAYLLYAATYYVGADGQPTGEAARLARAMRCLLDHCPALPPDEFTPRMLKGLRKKLIDKANPEGRGAYCRNSINQRLSGIKRMFCWAVEEELVPPSVYHGLQAVRGLKRGRSGARETEPVNPVPEGWVRKTMEFLPPTVAAMVELQMLTGMRPGEVCILRSRDVDTKGKIWFYRPTKHKTAIHGHKRMVTIGSRGQAVLRPFLKRAVDAFCFVPGEAEAQRHVVQRAIRKTHVQPSQQNRRCKTRSRPPGDHYSTCTYGRAVQYAIEAANRALLRQAQADGRKADDVQLVPPWHTNQLRHTAATSIRREMGLDAARAMLGHRTLGMADNYAEIDQALAVEVAKRLG